MKKELLEAEVLKITAIARSFGADKLYLFGSCIQDPESAGDIDVAVSGVQPSMFFELYGKILSAVRDIDVDLVPLEEARPHFIKRIFEQGRLIYG
jgi:predicted nucleotidyltransferase